MDEIILRSAADVERLALEWGFLPLFKNGIEGFSIEEHTPDDLWFADDADGPWEWKGPVIRGWQCAYGRIFDGKAGFVSLQWLPDLINWRRSCCPIGDATPDDSGCSRRRTVYDTLVAHESLLSKELKALCGFTRNRRPRTDGAKLLDRMVAHPGRGEGFDTVMGHLQMGTWVFIADFEYALDRHNHPYGWGLARYATPEALYGDGITDAGGRSPAESRRRMLVHLRQLLPGASDAQLSRMLDCRRQMAKTARRGGR